MVLHLLPQSKELVYVKGMCLLDADTLILLPAEAGDDAFFAACQLQAEVRAATGLALPIVKAYAPPRTVNVVLLACGQEQAAAFDLEPPQISAPEAVAAQAYALTIQRGRIVLYAGAPPGLFYAVQTLRQLVRTQGKALPTLRTFDWPTLPHRGLMLDVSRRKVPTLATLKHLVQELCHYKLNVLQLYTEHTFQFPRHPQIGSGCGSLSSQDIVELDAFCRQRHVELMPNLQSFGHARNTLLLPDYRHLAESDLLWTLSPAFEATYSLLDELYGDMLPAFSSATFNVCCDETFDLGAGASRPLIEEAGGMPAGTGRVYLDHILRVRELAARYGRRIQIWGDILLDHPELMDEVPEDVTLLAWCYDPADEYPAARTFAQSGRRFWVCPGTGSWNSLFPRLDGARINIRNLVRDGVAAGGEGPAPSLCEGMLNTDWGDSGHYQHLGLSWHGYLFGAAQGWTGGTTTDAEFDAAFGPLFFGRQHEAILEALGQLARSNDLPGVYRVNRSHTVLALFDDPLVGETVEGQDVLPGGTLVEMRTLADAAAVTCDALAPGHRRERTLREMASAARLTSYAARKTALGQAIRAGLREIAAAPQPESVRRLDDWVQALRALEAEMEQLRAEWEALWLARARRSEIHVALGYFASLRTRFRAAIVWLEAQREAMARGQGLDAELETYHPGEHRVLWQTWPD
ncbi:MAG TPA: glycoside hydrolase family 20 zincin-like fold domain-containing protein [Anaerolineae bacterium]|nr:glycoside hydrolase family 20 zincin-like fold domain-containing protein [Anaerolineae bacterium]